MPGGQHKVPLEKNPKQNKNISVSKGHVYLNDFGANLKGASTEFLAGTVCILSVHHADVSTASGRNHLYAGHTGIQNHIYKYRLLASNK